MSTKDMSSPLLGAALGAIAGAAVALFIARGSAAPAPAAMPSSQIEAIAKRAAEAAAPKDVRKYPAVGSPAKQVCHYCGAVTLDLAVWFLLRFVCLC